MKQYNILLRLDKRGHDVAKSLVTPAEVTLLAAMHSKAAGGNAIISSTDAPDVNRSDEDEVKRLRRTYGKRKVDTLFPGVKPNLPASLKEAADLGSKTPVAGNKLLVKA